MHVGTLDNCIRLRERYNFDCRNFYPRRISIQLENYFVRHFTDKFFLTILENASQNIYGNLLSICLDSLNYLRNLIVSSQLTVIFTLRYSTLKRKNPLKKSLTFCFDVISLREISIVHTTTWIICNWETNHNKITDTNYISGTDPYFIFCTIARFACTWPFMLIFCLARLLPIYRRSRWN